MAKPIGTLGTIDTITIGPRVFTDVSTIIILVSRWGGGAGNIHSTFRKTNSTAASGYQVPGAKTFQIHAIQHIIEDITGDIGNSTLLYADNDVGFSTATAFTNPLYMASNTTVGNLFFTTTSFDTVSKAIKEYAVRFDIPTGKFPAAEISAGGITQNLFAYGYEV